MRLCEVLLAFDRGGGSSHSDKENCGRSLCYCTQTIFMVTLKEKVEKLLEQKFTEKDFQDLFIVEVRQLAGEKIQVFIDSSTNLQLSRCAKISRYLEKAIEENAWLSERYTLEVSSPGVGEPLKLKRQYTKNIGRLVSVQIKGEHKHIQGILAEVKKSSIGVTYTERVRVEGRKKKENVTIRKEIAFDDILQTIVKTSFKTI